MKIKTLLTKAWTTLLAYFKYHRWSLFGLHSNFQSLLGITNKLWTPILFYSRIFLTFLLWFIFSCWTIHFAIETDKTKLTHPWWFDDLEVTLLWFSSFSFILNVRRRSSTFDGKQTLHAREWKKQSRSQKRTSSILE